MTVTAGGGVAIGVDGKKTETTVSAVGNVDVGTTGGVIKGATSTTGAVGIVALSNTLAISGNVSAATIVDIENVGTKSSNKISFAAGNQITADDVIVKVGPTVATVPPVPANVDLQQSAGGTDYPDGKWD